MPRLIKSRRSRIALLVILVIAVAGTGTAIALKAKGASTGGTTTHTVAGRKYVVTSDSGADGVPFKAKCPKGTHVVGGGAGADLVTTDINESRPWDSKDKGGVPDDGWIAYFNETSGGVRVYAICE